MTHRTHHEQIYRGREAMDKLKQASIHICGAGALGSNLAVNLARAAELRLTVIDRDRVEEHNIGTQAYSLEDVGGQKAEILRNIIYREVGSDVSAVAQEVSERNIGKLLKGATLVVDSFDNSKSRQLIYDYCKTNNIHCLHAGVNNQYGEVIWNEQYRVPSDAGEDICDYPLARNLIIMVVALASESLIRFLSTGVKENYSITLGDMSVNQEY